MSTKKDEGGGAMIIIGTIAIVVALLLLPCLIYGFVHRTAVIKRLRISENARHVFDAGKIWTTVKGYYAECIGMGLLLGIVAMIGSAVSQDLGGTTRLVMGIIYLAICLLILFGMTLATGIATGIAAIGVWIDPATNRLVFPHDGVSRSFDDLVTFRWVLGGLVMAEVPLDEIASMTREAGKTVLVQGDFGSCQIAFSSKLKRDDCFNAIKAASRQVGINPQVRWW